MAKRRFISKDVTHQSRFISMPLETQGIYAFLVLEADDDGYVEALSVLRMHGANEQNLSVLKENGLIKVFPGMVVYIVDWKKMNKVEPSKKTDSIYLPLYPIDCLEKVEKMSRQSSEQVRIGKDRLGKDRERRGENTPRSNKPNKREEKEHALRFLEGFNKVLGTKFKATPFERNLTYWLEFYTWDDISMAIGAVKNGLWWPEKPTPTLFLRTKDRQGNPVDYIGELTELWRKK